MILIYLIALAVLLAASYTDLKTREVPDWLNYALIAVGFGVAAVMAVSEWSFLPVAHSVAGFAVMSAIGYFMYYTGQWGGADSKLLMGLGALFGIELSVSSFMATFIVNFLAVSVVYGLCWSVYLAVKNWGKFAKVMDRELEKWRLLRFAVLAVSVALIPVVFFTPDFYVKAMLVSMVVIIVATFYVWIFAHAVEKSSMLRFVSPEKLTVGDWIAEDVVVSGKRIAGPKDLGVEAAQIKQLISLKRRGKIRKVLLKEGIPFVPSFLLAFIVSYFVGNLFLLLL